MSANRPRIDRRIVCSRPADRQETPDPVVVFVDGWGEVTSRYDHRILGLPPDVTVLFAEAFRHHHAASTRETQRHCWLALRTFARFATVTDSVHSTRDLTSAALESYIDWLHGERNQRTGNPWTKKTKANLLAQLRQLINWTKRHHPARLPARIDFPYRVYPDRNSEPRLGVAALQLKAILRACYEEIDEAWKRFEIGQSVLASTDAVTDLTAEHCRLLRTVAAVYDGVLPSQNTVLSQGITRETIKRQGGLRLLGTYLHLTVETTAPFYMAILIQLAGNPHAVHRITRDCQVPHPLDENRTIVDWNKPRSGRKFKRAQRRSFDKRKRYAAPNLIDKVLAMTAPLLSRTAPRHRNRLFLTMSEKKHLVTPIPDKTLAASIKRFINRANQRIEAWNDENPDRPRTLLQDFPPTLLRGSVAIEHYKAAVGDITVPQRVLNHVHAATTDTYVKGPETDRIQRETVARLQGLMISWITGTAHSGEHATPPDDVAVGADAAAPFAHRCLNPLAGRAPGTTAGRVCRHFGGCLRCSGLVIPIDVAHLARLLQAKHAFERARDSLEPRRWQLLYAPSYRTLVDEILPDFPETLHPAAEHRLQTMPLLPALE